MYSNLKEKLTTLLIITGIEPPHLSEIEERRLIITTKCNENRIRTNINNAVKDKHHLNLFSVFSRPGTRNKSANFGKRRQALLHQIYTLNTTFPFSKQTEKKYTSKSLK